MLLAYVGIATLLFEYTINEAANTILTICGILAFLILTFITVRIIVKLIKPQT